LARYVSNISQKSSETKEKRVLITVVHDAIKEAEALSNGSKDLKEFSHYIIIPLSHQF
jgi:hypothetical protein